MRGVRPRLAFFSKPTAWRFAGKVLERRCVLDPLSTSPLLAHDPDSATGYTASNYVVQLIAERYAFQGIRH
jgi:hypothetical protein